MSNTQGIDTSLQGTADVCLADRWLNIGESDGNIFIQWWTPSGTPDSFDMSSVDDYGWATTYDHMAVRFTWLVIPLISGVWQWGIPSEDDLSRLRVKESHAAGKTLLDTTDNNYHNIYMTAGREYWMEGRWYELIGPGNFDPRFKYPGDATARVIQSTASVCKIRKYNGYVDNTPLLSVVL